MVPTSPTPERWWQRHWTFLLALVLFAAAGVVINPLREAAVDDDFAYVLTTRHLSAAGTYRLHDWVAPDMPFQAAWGALFTWAFGDSFVTLRVSTLIVSLIGLFGLYGLAREHGLERDTAGVMTLSWIASPLVLYFTYTFCTDVHFLAWLLVALWAYSRALRLGPAIGPMFVASLPATAAMLTRQLGAALPCALLCIFASQRRHWRRPLPFVAGILLPALAAIAVLSMPPTSWASVMQREAMRQHYADPAGVLRSGLLLRPMYALHFVALFAAPWVVVACWNVLRARRARDVAAEGERRSRRDEAIVGSALLFLLAAMAVDGRWAMPLLPWYSTWIEGASVPVTIFTLAGAVLLARIVALRYVARARDLTPGQYLLDATTLLLAGATFAFYKMGDKYVLPLLPFVLIVTARHLRAFLRGRLAVVIALAVACLAVSSNWVRAGLARDEAQWKAAEWLVARGARPAEVYASWNWMAYYRFDEYVAEISRRPISVMHFFDVWVPAQSRNACYVVVEGTPPARPGRLTHSFPFRGFLGEPLAFYAAERTHVDHCDAQRLPREK